MFLRMGYINATRNITRSILAVISMAVAAVILTSALSISRGYPREAYRRYRQMIGGEIVAYPLKITGEMESGDQSQPWQLNRLQSSELSDLAVFHPELFRGGFLAEGQTELHPFGQEQIQAISQQPGVGAVYPYYLMPASTLVNDAGNQGYRSPLRGRDLSLDQLAGDLGKAVVEGRYLAPDDDGQMVAVVSSKQLLPSGILPPRVGSEITIEVPTLTVRDGIPVFNYEQMVRKTLKVVGQYQLDTRIFGYMLDSGQIMSEQLYWHTPEIEIPLSTWQSILQEAGGANYHPYELAIHVPNLTYLEDTVLHLNKTFPQFSFVSVPKVAEMAADRGLIEPMFDIPRSAVGYREATQQNALPLDLRRVLLTLVYLNAALVVAANMLIAVNDRKEEIGILKAIGARSLDILTMAQSEGMMLSALGASIGFVLIRLFAVINQLTNHVALGTVLRSVLTDYLLVMGSTLSVAMLFGIIPALKLSSLTAMEVLRHE